VGLPVQAALVALYVVVLCTVAFYGCTDTSWLPVPQAPAQRVSAQGKFGDLPRVTVQLPMFNEDVVAERVIRATCLIDYPLDKLEIQVLDDSTDHSADIARKACEDWAAKGYPVHYIHRTIAKGTKPARWPKD